MSVLVTGGAGYIGSHAVLALLDAGESVVVLDDLSTGRDFLIPRQVTFVRGSVGDRQLVADTLKEHRVEAVMHFAASIIVHESVEQPLTYYQNNTVNSHALIQSCIEQGVNRFVFSSTAAVYGEPEVVPIPEDAPKQPVNPYGSSKLMTEWMLRDAAAAHGLQYAVLRYFNVAGADPQGRAGEAPLHSTHLIKIACEAALGIRPQIAVFGTDYPTPDGTCVRDYIHVSDLADAHLLALRHLAGGGESFTANCGYGHGFSVAEVLTAVERVLGRPLPQRIAERRPGDPASLVAKTGKIGEVLGWTPKYDDLDMIIRTALQWEEWLMNRPKAAQ